MSVAELLEGKLRTDERDSLPKPIGVFLDVAIVLNMTALACEAVVALSLNLGLPYVFPLLNEGWAGDLTNYQRLFPFIHTPGFFQSVGGITYAYPAPVALLYGFFLSFHNPVHALEWTLVLLLVAAALGFALHLRRKGVSEATAVYVSGGAMVLSYPAAVELRQGNMELFVTVLVGAGIYCFLRGKTHTAAVCIGAAGAMKIFPFVYLGLFLTRSRYRALGTAILSAAILTVVSLLYIDPSLTVAWHGVQNGLAIYQRGISPTIHPQTPYDHSVFAVLKLLHFGFTNSSTVPMETLYTYLMVVATGGIVLFFVRIRHMPVINQVMCLCVASIILPPVSYDYTLLNLYIPWAMLVCFSIDRQNVKTAGLTAAFVCFGIATSIQSEIIYHGRSEGGQIKAIALCVLMVVALRYPFSKGQYCDSPVGGGAA